MGSDGHRLAQLMRQAGRTPQNEIVDIVVGQVTSVKPLKIKIENRELTESFLILSALCKEYRIDASAFTVPTHTHGIPSNTTQTASNHAHTVPASATEPATSTPSSVILWRGLKVGDKVEMLKVGRGQKYWVLQRQEGVTIT